MLLETGVVVRHLVNHAPDNAAATVRRLAAHQREPRTSGDPESSFIYHKITGDLPDPPWRPHAAREGKLNRTCGTSSACGSSGAPQTGWVPGTY